MKKRKNKITRRSRSTGKRRPSRAIRPNVGKGCGCDLLRCLTKVVSPVMRVLGIR